MPAGLMDRKPEHWLGEASLCRKLLEELAERELAYLRPREERLRKSYRDAGAGQCGDPQAGAPGPGRGPAAAAGGEPQSPVRPRLRRLREGACPERQDRPAAGSTRGGPARRGGRRPRATVAPEPVSVEQGVARRKQAAEVLAPGGENGIGPPIFRGDSGAGGGGGDGSALDRGASGPARPRSGRRPGRDRQATAAQGEGRRQSYANRARW